MVVGKTIHPWFDPMPPLALPNKEVLVHARDRWLPWRSVAVFRGALSETRASPPISQKYLTHPR